MKHNPISEKVNQSIEKNLEYKEWPETSVARSLKDGKWDEQVDRLAGKLSYRRFSCSVLDRNGSC